jgi:CubicO group peptidase (beta-lactamase class C family)
MIHPLFSKSLAMTRRRPSFAIATQLLLFGLLGAGALLPAKEPIAKPLSDQEAKRENLEFCAAICAHHICSGLWVVGREYQRTPEEVVAQDIAPFSYFGWQPDFKYEVDMERRIVTVTAPGAPPRSATYTGDQGSTILPRGRDSVFFEPVPVPRHTPDADKQDWPMGDVDATRPVPAGVDSDAVAAALDWAMDQEEHNTRAFVVACEGKIIGERYAPGWTRDTPQISWSQGKSITATLVGILAQRGLLEIDQPAPIKEWQGEGDPRSQIRIRDLLQMSSGLDFTNLGFKGETLTRKNQHMRVYFDSLNVLEHAISPPLEVPPGTRCAYRNSDPLSLGKIIRDTVEAQGEDYLTFPQRALFDRIGARSPVLETDAWGNFILSGYDYLSARDWIRFGQLYLQDGVWEGERILPEGWTEFVATPAPADKEENYGGMFWLNRAPRMDMVPKDAYWSAGFMGQVTMIIPSRKLVVVRMGPSASDVYSYLNETIGRILKAIP